MCSFLSWDARACFARVCRLHHAVTHLSTSWPSHMDLSKCDHDAIKDAIDWKQAGRRVVSLTLKDTCLVKSSWPLVESVLGAMSPSLSRLDLKNFQLQCREKGDANTLDCLLKLLSSSDGLRELRCNSISRFCWFSCCRSMLMHDDAKLDRLIHSTRSLTTLLPHLTSLTIAKEWITVQQLTILCSSPTLATSLRVFKARVQFYGIHSSESKIVSTLLLRLRSLESLGINMGAAYLGELKKLTRLSDLTVYDEYVMVSEYPPPLAMQWSEMAEFTQLQRLKLHAGALCHSSSSGVDQENWWRPLQLLSHFKKLTLQFCARDAINTPSSSIWPSQRLHNTLPSPLTHLTLKSCASQELDALDLGLRHLTQLESLYLSARDGYIVDMQSFSHCTTLHTLTIQASNVRNVLCLSKLERNGNLKTVRFVGTRLQAESVVCLELKECGVMVKLH